MIKVADLKPYTVNEVGNIFSFVVENNFDKFTSLKEMRDLIKNEFISSSNDFNNKKTRDSYIKTIKSFDFFNKENYFVFDDENLFNLMNNLSSFRDEVVFYIDLTYNDKRKEYKLIREVSPPLEAYEYVGHSKLSIKPTGRDFALLFE